MGARVRVLFTLFESELLLLAESALSPSSSQFLSECISKIQEYAKVLIDTPIEDNLKSAITEAIALPENARQKTLFG